MPHIFALVMTRIFIVLLTIVDAKRLPLSNPGFDLTVPCAIIYREHSYRGQIQGFKRKKWVQIHREESIINKLPK